MIGAKFVLASLAIAGCTGRAPPDKASELATAAGVEQRPPCQYMARADAEAAVGLPLPGTTENVVLGLCDYTTAEFYSASLTVGDWTSIKNAATGGGPHRQPTTVTDVGDEALSLKNLLYVRKGDRGFLLSLNGPEIDHSADGGLERTKTLARTILPNL